MIAKWSRAFLKLAAMPEGGTMIAIDEQTARFLMSPVMIIMGTADAGLMPAIGRGLGCRLTERGEVEIVFSRWQWPRVASDLAVSHRLAATWARPSDYVSYQLKGSVTLRSCAAEDRTLAERYCADMTRVLTALGVSREQVGHWIVPRDLAVARMTVAEAYVQTPGQRAGVKL